jgi:pyruvate-formate lyase-activating enzyme
MSSIRGLVADVVPSSVVDGPGNRYVVFLQGCGFNCLACHNPHTISRHPVGEARWAEVDELVADLAEVAPFLSGVTVSGGEATGQWEFVRDLFVAVRAAPATAGLTTLVDSNGDAPVRVWDALAPVTDGVMVDLKAMDPDVHRWLTSRDNSSVLRSVEHLAAIGKLDEVRVLVIPTVNDGADALARTAAFLAGVDPDVRVTLLAFRHDGARPAGHRLPEATTADLERAATLLVEHGLSGGSVRLGWQPPQADGGVAPARPVVVRSTR